MTDTPKPSRADELPRFSTTRHGSYTIGEFDEYGQYVSAHEASKIIRELESSLESRLRSAIEEAANEGAEWQDRGFCEIKELDKIKSAILARCMEKKWKV